LCMHQHGHGSNEGVAIAPFSQAIVGEPLIGMLRDFVLTKSPQATGSSGVLVRAVPRDPERDPGLSRTGSERC